MSIRTKISNVQLHFPNIFQAKERPVFGDTVLPLQYAGFFSFSKDNREAKEILDIAFDAILSGRKKGDFKYCVKDGDESTYDMFIHKWYIQSTSATEPVLINSEGEVIIDQVDALYAGRYVDVVLDMWVMDNAYGKRVNATLVAIQLKNQED